MPRNRPDRQALARAADWIRASKRPLIVSGGGVLYSDASDMLRRFVERTGAALPIPTHTAIQSVPEKADADEDAKAIDQPAHDVIIVDTPGHDSPLGQIGHTYADILVTPINDSLIDLEAVGLARIDRLMSIRLPSSNLARIVASQISASAF